ncbi:hypothetical protein [Sporosarcina sp. FSL W7-1283]|uniref:hypothetical protein n=1 Tax=Sporosarcina sp. FSL W7-1283 TaxID=2921560 RepID=UPI0030F7B503
MHMKNYEVKEFGDFLYLLKLKGKQSRMRNRLVKLLEEHLLQVETERQHLVEEYALKDENGEIIFDDNNNIDFKDEQGLRKEIAVLMTEEYILEESLDKQEMFSIIREIIEEYGESTEMSGEESMNFERFCEFLDI